MGLPTLGLGALVGYLAAGSKITPTSEDIKHLIAAKPEYYTVVDIDLSTARDNVEFVYSGNFIWVDNHFARGKVTIRLNEPNFKELDLRRQKFISGPFYRFFITNAAGQGSIKLIVSRGFEFASEPVEAIKLDELAARLGSPVIFDRRGDVVWFDDFEDGIQKFRKGPGGGVNWTAEYSKSKGFSCEIVTPAVINTGTLIKHEMPLPVFSRIGVEFSFSYEGGISPVYFPIVAYDGTQRHGSAIIWNSHILWPDNTFLYYGADADYHALSPTKVLHEGFRIFHVIKLVIDLDKDEYVRLICDELEYDMTGIKFYTVADIINEPQLYFDISMTSHAAASVNAYVDDVIVTQNEP